MFLCPMFFVTHRASESHPYKFKELGNHDSSHWVMGLTRPLQGRWVQRFSNHDWRTHHRTTTKHKENHPVYGTTHNSVLVPIKDTPFRPNIYRCVCWYHLYAPNLAKMLNWRQAVSHPTSTLQSRVHGTCWRRSPALGKLIRRSILPRTRLPRLPCKSLIDQARCCLAHHAYTLLCIFYGYWNMHIWTVPHNQVW